MTRREQGRRKDEILAAEKRTRDLVVGDAEEEGRQGRTLERSAQPHRQAEYDGDEEGRSGLLLPYGRGEGRGRHCRGDRRVPSRSHRRERHLRAGDREGG